MPSKIKIPSIEIPRDNDMKSMVNSIHQIKEAIELMSGQRGDGFFLTTDDLSLLQQNINLYKYNAWETIADEYIPSTKAKDYVGLGDYHTLRIIANLVPLTDATKWPYLRAGVNGVLHTAYSGTLRYNIEGSATVLGSVTPDGTVVPWSWTNLVTSATTSSYGSHIEMTITNFNAAANTMFNTQASWYTGTNLLQGEFVYRQIGQQAFNQIHVAMTGDATDFSLRILLEGKKRRPA